MMGSTGLFESLEPAHLHLEMLKDGVYVDPQEYITFSQNFIRTNLVIEFLSARMYN